MRVVRRLGVWCAMGLLLSLVPGALVARGLPEEPVNVEERSSGAATAEAAPFALIAPTETAQGGVVPLLVDGGHFSAVQARMTFANGVESHAHGWRDESATDRWIVMFGVGSTAPVGPARIDVVATGSDGSAQSSGHDLVVASGAFRSERIALNSPMTELRSSDDPLKTTQSERLWSVLQTTDLNVRYHRAPFVIPVPTVRITSRYGDRRVFAYSDGREARSIHYGVDFAAPTGTPISAPGAGRVVMAENRILTGYTIVLEHLPGVYSMYYHLDELAVAEGAEVSQGDLLGTVGSTGLSTGPHLHWEIRVSGVPVDPFLFVDTHPVPAATARGGQVEQQNATLDRPDSSEASSAVRSGEGG